MSRALEVFRFELGYQIRRVSTRIYLAVFLGLSLMMTYAFLLDARNDGYFFNAPIITMAVSIIASMFSLLVIAGVAGDAATRDLETRLDSLLFTTPVGKAAYLGGRFLGAFAVTALLLLAVPIVLLLATKFPGLEPEILGPFRPAAYLASYFFFAVPNAFVGTAIVFAFAALTRRAIASYGGAALLFFSTFLSETVLADRMGHWWIGRMADPLGYTTLRAFWRTLNPLQKNTLLPGLDGALLTNRLVWMSIALSVLAFACARFRFAIRSAATPLAVPAPEAERAGVVSSRETRRVFGARQLLAITIESFRDLVLSRGWLIAPLVAVLFVFTAPELLEVELGTPGAATTARVAALFGPSELAFLITLLIALSAGELVWRERDSRIDAIADVTPVPEWVAVTGKFLAIALMLAFTHAIFLLAGIGVQTVLGYPQLIDVALYIKIIFGFQLTGYLLVAALAMAIHVLVNQKYVGNVLVLLAFLATQMAREVGVHHNLLLYGGAPEWTYSEMIGFGPEVTAWRWFTLYWSGWALLLGLAGYLFWIRGAERGLRTRIALARRRLTRWPAAIGATALMIIAGAGGFVFYNTNVLNHYYTDAELDARRVEYERRYGRYASLPQPLLAATKLHVDFYPQRNAASIRGSYRLENRGNAAIYAIHVVSHSGLETNSITFDRASRLTHDDRDFGYRIYALARPLQPGESVRMNFDIAYERRGFTNDGANPAVLHNGSWIQHRAEHTHGQRQWLPVIGYQPNRAPDRDEPRLEDVAARHDTRGREKIAFEAVVGTDEGQLGVAPGTLRRQWTANGRSYAHYVTDAPITNGYAIFSANYAVHRARWKHIDIEIFHHPSHTANLERMVRSVRASLDYHTRHFSPYPFEQVRLVEYPSSGRGLRLTAHNGAIMYSEGFALVRPDDDPREIDLPFAVMAHEMGHQWWGHQLMPANVEGAALVSESLAWYSGMLVVEETLGREHLMRLLAMMRREYLAPHQTRQAPLLRASDRMDAYRIGPFAMYAVREAAGTERVNAALRSLLAKYPPGRPPFATTLDLYAELRAATPPASHALLKDLFEEVTYWDLRAKKLDVQRAGNAWRVTLHVDAEKLKANALGQERPAPMNDLVEVAAFDRDGKGVYRGSHRIRTGSQTITFLTPHPPARAAVDPDHELFDRKPDDNEARL